MRQKKRYSETEEEPSQPHSRSPATPPFGSAIFPRPGEVGPERGSFCFAGKAAAIFCCRERIHPLRRQTASAGEMGRTQECAPCKKRKFDFLPVSFVRRSINLYLDTTKIKSSCLSQKIPVSQNFTVCYNNFTKYDDSARLYRSSAAGSWPCSCAAKKEKRGCNS